MKLLAVNVLLYTYLFLMVRPAVPLAADFVAHTLWSHHHHAHDHNGQHTHLNDDLKNASDDDHDSHHKSVHDYKTELYFAPQPLEYQFAIAVKTGKPNFFFHSLKSLAVPSALSPPPENVRLVI